MFEQGGVVNLRRREPIGGWSAQPIEQVPLRDCAEEAPSAERKGKRTVRPDEALPVTVWLTQRQSRDMEVTGWAVAWTDRQVWVRYLDKHGREGYAWVWASAVTRR